MRTRGGRGCSRRSRLPSPSPRGGEGTADRDAAASTCLELLDKDKRSKWEWANH